MGAGNKVAWTAPGGVAGATETVHEGRGNGRARLTYETQHGHEYAHDVKASASNNSYGRSVSDVCADESG